jgi:hypothetical protein
MGHKDLREGLWRQVVGWARKILAGARFVASTPPPSREIVAGHGKRRVVGCVE